MAHTNGVFGAIHVSMAHTRAATQNTFTGLPSPYGSNVRVSSGASDASARAAVISASSYER